MRIDSFLAEQKFIKCRSEHGVYVRSMSEKDLLIVCLYVDDLLVTGSDEREISMFKQTMKNEFKMTDLGNFVSFSRIRV